MYEILKDKCEIENQRKFAEEIGTSYTTLNKILKGKRLCSKVLAYAITKNYNSGFEIEDLFKKVK